MLKISRLDAATRVTVLRLEGRLTAGDFAELDSILQACRRERRRVVLDLAGLVFLDDDCARAIRAAGPPKLEIVGASSFVQHLLCEES